MSTGEPSHPAFARTTPGTEDCGVTNFVERDVDLFLAEELAVNPAFTRWWLGHSGRSGVVRHPARWTNVSVHADGSEADVIADFDRLGGGVHRVFVEDKIAAALMPRQLERYVRRGEGDVRMNRCRSFDVFLFAPGAYAASLPHGVRHVSFEAVAQALPSLGEGKRGRWRASFLMAALPVVSVRERDRQVAATDPFVAEWWTRVYEALEQRHAGYFVHRTQFPRSTYFAPARKDQGGGIRVDFKGHLGEVDLAFKNVPARRLTEALGQLPAAPGRVVENGRSSAIRIENLAPVIIADGYDAIPVKMMAHYDAARTLLDYWHAHRTRFEALRDGG